jgi:hypothetical protein
VIDATLQSWSAWSPGIETNDAWRVWAKAPHTIGSEGRPEAMFLPRMLRRRCGTLARLMLTTAFDCCEGEEVGEVATVFGSRHGNINESIDLLDRLALRKPLSPTAFSHTVHNAQAGLFSIAANNRSASSSVAAQQHTFACSYLEAMTLLQRDPQRPVLLVVADVPLAPTFARLVDEAPGAYGLALLLSSEGEGEARLRFDPNAGSSPDSPPAWPDAIEFLRWLLSGQEQLTLGSDERPWTFRRMRGD